MHVENTDVLAHSIFRPLVPQADALSVSLPELDLSYFSAIFSAALPDVLKTALRTMLLIPHNKTFKCLDILVSDRLLSASSKPILETDVLHYIIDNDVYASSANQTARTYTTLEGSELRAKRTENGMLVINNSESRDTLSCSLCVKISRTGSAHPRTLGRTHTALEGVSISFFFF